MTTQKRGGSLVNPSALSEDAAQWRRSVTGASSSLSWIPPERTAGGDKRQGAAVALRAGRSAQRQRSGEGDRPIAACAPA